jgi:hypothetical protein
MSKLREQLLAVATCYAANRGRSLLRFLGDGNDGAVWESDQQTAIKKTLEKATSFKPTFRSWPESVGQFEQAAAGEELAGVGQVHSNGNVGLGIVQFITFPFK